MKNGFVSVNFGCVARRGVGKSLVMVIVSMYLFGFDADAYPTRKGGQGAALEEPTMITIDVISCIMYAQLTLSIALFFFVQALVLFARGRMETLGDWIVYRGCWVGVAIQAISMGVLAWLVFSTQTDPARVGWTCALIFANAAWFVTLRLAFLIADHRYRQENSVI